jgi:hypothetical protein
LLNRFKSYLNHWQIKKMLYQNFSRMFQQTTTSRSLVKPIILTTTLSLCSCGASNNDGIACTAEARASVMLTVIDVNNNYLPDVFVSYSVDNSSPRTQICESNGVCLLEYETQGEFSITASKAGYLSTSATVNVSRSTCHVNTERIVLTLNKSS